MNFSSVWHMIKTENRCLEMSFLNTFELVSYRFLISVRQE
jgi:hypothetical protein